MSGSLGNPIETATVSGSYDSHDKRQENRATIGAGTIIIRSDPTQGLAGLNRDLQKAQELTKDSQTSVKVYVDAAAIKEVASGFKGTTDNFTALVGLVKTALMKEGHAGADIVDSLENQLSTRDKLIRTGMSVKDANAVIEGNSAAAAIQGELEKKIAEKGGLDKLTNAEAQEILDSIKTNPDISVMLSGSLVGLGLNAGHLAAGSLAGILQGAGQDAKSALSYMNALSWYILWSASGGLAFMAQAQQFSDTNARIITGVNYILSNPSAAASAVGGRLQEKLKEFNTAIDQGNVFHAGELIGQLLYQTAIIAASVPGVGKATLSGLASISPEVAVALEAGGGWKAGVTSGASKTAFTIEHKIAGQMGERGWTFESISSAIDSPVKTVLTKDTRFDPSIGKRLNQPATAYYAQDGSYVVRNDMTGKIVQVSNKFDKGWIAPWD